MGGGWLGRERGARSGGECDGGREGEKTILDRRFSRAKSGKSAPSVFY